MSKERNWELRFGVVERPKGLDELLGAVRSILTEQDRVHMIAIEQDRPIRYAQWIEGKGGDVVDEASKNCETMQEVPPDRFGLEMLQYLFLAAARRRLFITHIAIGPNSSFWEWVGLDPIADVEMEVYFNAQICIGKELPPETVLFFTNAFPAGTLFESRFCYKCAAIAPDKKNG